MLHGAVDGALAILAEVGIFQLPCKGLSLCLVFNESHPFDCFVIPATVTSCLPTVIKTYYHQSCSILFKCIAFEEPLQRNMMKL